MINRAEFNKKAETILNFVDTYGVLRCKLLEKLLKMLVLLREKVYNIW